MRGILVIIPNRMNMEAVLLHLEKLVDINPISGDQKRVLDALNYCKGAIQQTGGFKSVEVHNFNGVYSLIASTRNSKKSKLILQAHMDVVPAPQTFGYIQKDGWLYGRGVYDMLFAPACYLALIHELSDSLADMDISIMLSGDEELGGINGVNALLINGYVGDVCILPDGGQGFGEINISGKGVYQLDLIAEGSAHHGSRPWEGDGAANKLVFMLSELLKSFDHTAKDASTVTVTRLNAGDADNKGPGEARSRLDIRYKNKYDLQLIQSWIEQITQKYGGSIDNIHIGDDYQLDIENRFVQKFIKMYEQDIGKRVKTTRSPGSSDARFFAAHGVPVIELRPDGGGAHSDNERINIDSLSRFYKLLTRYVKETAKI